MSEFEIYQNANLIFINNAIYLLCVVVMTALAFYLIRRTRELNLPLYSKVVMTIFCTCVIFFGLQVSSFLVQAQKNMSYQLSELEQSGSAISGLGKSVIDQFVTTRVRIIDQRQNNGPHASVVGLPISREAPLHPDTDII